LVGYPAEGEGEVRELLPVRPAEEYRSQLGVLEPDADKLLDDASALIPRGSI
jgi:hypothetical protein